MGGAFRGKLSYRLSGRFTAGALDGAERTFNHPQLKL